MISHIFLLYTHTFHSFLLVILHSLCVDCSFAYLQFCYFNTDNHVCHSLVSSYNETNMTNTGVSAYLAVGLAKRNHNRCGQAPCMRHPWVLPKNKYPLTQIPLTCLSNTHVERINVCLVRMYRFSVLTLK